MAQISLNSIMKVDSTYQLAKDLYMDGKHFSAGLMFCCLDREDDSCTLALLTDIDNKITVNSKIFENYFIEK
jgi:hypothetical protein